MDMFDKAKRSQIMSRIRSTDTTPEVRLRKALFSHGFRYRKNVRGLTGTPDIVLPKHKYVIQVRGCFWHGHDCRRAGKPSTNIEYWQPKLAKNVARDIAADEALAQQGWRVKVVWECEIRSKANFDNKVAQIVQELTG